MAIPLAGSGYQITDGSLSNPILLIQQVPISLTASVTALPSDLVGNTLFLANPAAATNLTLPTVASLELAFQSFGEKAGVAFEFDVININATNAVTIVTNTGWTITSGGNMVVALLTSARFLARKTGFQTWQLYRTA